MSRKEKQRKNNQLPGSIDQNEDDDQGGQSGQGEGIAFRDFTTSAANWRDDTLPYIDQNEDDDQGGQSGQGEGVAFRDFTTSVANWRDDTLPYEEMKRLLVNHQDIHELRVKQQKDKRDQYKNLKEGKIPLQEYRAGLAGGGMGAKYKTNPELANKAQFSGIDRQVNPVSTEHLADTNQEQRNELENKLRYRLGYQPTPTFNPKPRGPGY